MHSGLDNHLSDATSRSLKEIIRANVLNLFDATVGTSFSFLHLLGSWQDALFGLAAIGNAVIGVVQEYRAQRSLELLTGEADPVDTEAGQRCSPARSLSPAGAPPEWSGVCRILVEQFRR